MVPAPCRSGLVQAIMVVPERTGLVDVGAESGDQQPKSLDNHGSS